MSGNDFSSIIALLNRKISVNAWMGKQQCQWAVRRVLEKIGDEKILLQCDGYESFLNALESEDKKGQIRELISSSQCTDLCSIARL